MDLLIVVVGVTFVVIATPPNTDVISPVLLCVGDDGDCASASRDDVIPIFLKLHAHTYTHTL